jgi:hypothetical protein
VEEAAAQEGVRQLLLVVRRDDDDRAMLRAHQLARLVDEELHAVEFRSRSFGNSMSALSISSISSTGR